MRYLELGIKEIYNALLLPLYLPKCLWSLSLLSLVALLFFPRPAMLLAAVQFLALGVILSSFLLQGPMTFVPRLYIPSHCITILLVAHPVQYSPYTGLRDVCSANLRCPVHTCVGSSRTDEIRYRSISLFNYNVHLLTPPLHYYIQYVQHIFY